MKLFRLLSLLCLLSFLILVSGCGLRPQENTTIITISAGKPVMIVDTGKNGQDVVVRAQEVVSKKVVQQKVNGWMSMPPDHWQVVKEKLNGVAKYETEHSISIPSLADVVPLK